MNVTAKLVSFCSLFALCGVNFLEEEIFKGRFLNLGLMEAAACKSVGLKAVKNFAFEKAF